VFDIPLFQFGFSAHSWALSCALICLFVLGLSFSTRLSTVASGHLQRHPRSALLLLAFSAAGLSLLYFRDFLGGGPRIIDATAYLLEARTFLSGKFTFSPPEPSDLFTGRFLLRALENPREIGVIFPPGYPAILAIFEGLWSYVVLGPTLAFLLVVATYELTRRLVLSEAESSEVLRKAPLLAAVLSASAMTLRYHTADTMSHGLSTLLVASMLTLCLGAEGATPRWRSFALGLLGGLLFATRPLTAICALIPVALLEYARVRRRFAGWHPEARRLSWLLLGALPGVGLYLAYQKALTGHYFGSAQLSYYLLGDGPGSCFGLGFGKGCLHEHGDVIRERGYLSPLWALLNSLHRLHQHSLDLANFEPIALLLAVWLWRERATLKSRLALTLLLSLTGGYAFFYFDGSYPGGGGRFLVEALPLEQACLAICAVRYLASLRILALSLAGFSVHGIFSHLALRDRDGGAPFLAPRTSQLRAPGLVFVASDHAFLSGFDPRNLTPKRRAFWPIFAHRSYDAREALLLRAMGSPPAFRLEAEPPGSVLVPFSTDPLLSGSPLTFEAERTWPALSVRGVWAHPEFGAANCVSQGRGLLVTRDRTRKGSPQLEFWLGTLGQQATEARVHFWSKERGCFIETVSLTGNHERLTVPLEGLFNGSPLGPAKEGPLLLDFWQLQSNASPPNELTQ
jgi:hypothetical protein